VRVSDIERAVARAFPPERAEDWDRVGLLAGDPDTEVTGVALALDPSVAAIEASVAVGANVLVTHHPAFLNPPQWLTPGRGSSGVVFAALSHGVALVNAHTNLDRDPEAQLLLPEALGLAPIKPVERSVQPMALVTVYAPEAAAQRIIDAMAGAGAGRVGAYERCAFEAPGTGLFTPGLDSDPAVGSPGARSNADELRIEMVCPRIKARGVVSAAAAAHPYEEPLVVVRDVEIARNAARMGMLSDAPSGTTLRDMAAKAAETFEVTPRVWGDPDAASERVATATGSASSLVGDVLAAGAQTLVAGEVRYHDALDAVAVGLSVIELGHDVSEQPLVALLERAVRGVPGLEPGAVHRLGWRAAWWTPRDR
jgi:putative NIF3 family GTP cyclohydrolase 1 type 2